MKLASVYRKERKDWYVARSSFTLRKMLRSCVTKTACFPGRWHVKGGAHGPSRTHLSTNLIMSLCRGL